MGEGEEWTAPEAVSWSRTTVGHHDHAIYLSCDVRRRRTQAPIRESIGAQRARALVPAPSVVGHSQLADVLPVDSAGAPLTPPPSMFSPSLNPLPSPPWSSAGEGLCVGFGQVPLPTSEATTANLDGNAKAQRQDRQESYGPSDGADEGRNIMVSSTVGHKGRHGE